MLQLKTPTVIQSWGGGQICSVQMNKNVLKKQIPLNMGYVGELQVVVFMCLPLQAGWDRMEPRGGMDHDTIDDASS